MTDYKHMISLQEELNRFKELLDEIFKLKTSKVNGYGQSWRAFGLGGVNGKISTEFSKIWVNKDKIGDTKDEERDSYLKLSMYAIMAVQLIDEKDTEDKVSNLLNHKEEDI